MLLVHVVSLFVLLCAACALHASRARLEPSSCSDMPLVLPMSLVHFATLVSLVPLVLLSRVPLVLLVGMLAPVLRQIGNWELSRVAPSKQLPRHVRDRVFSAYKEATKLEDDNYKAWHCWAMVRPLSLVRHTGPLIPYPLSHVPCPQPPTPCPLSLIPSAVSPVPCFLSPVPSHLSPIPCLVRVASFA